MRRCRHRRGRAVARCAEPVSAVPALPSHRACRSARSAHLFHPPYLVLYHTVPEAPLLRAARLLRFVGEDPPAAAAGASLTLLLKVTGWAGGAGSFERGPNCLQAPADFAGCQAVEVKTMEHMRLLRRHHARTLANTASRASSRSDSASCSALNRAARACSRACRDPSPSSSACSSASTCSIA